MDPSIIKWRVPLQGSECLDLFFCRSYFDNNAARTPFQKRDEHLFPVIPESHKHRGGQLYKGILENHAVREDFDILTAMLSDIIV